MSALLEVRNLRAGYGPVEVLRGVSLAVDAGEIVALLGSNGAGKMTTLNAIAGITKALSNEWAARGVQVNAIAPGYFATDNTQPLRDDAGRAESILARIPAGRWGQPEDLTGAAVFLASHASDYVNGHLLVVDGGQVIH